jgi:AcrR family transcriptional regulator
MGDHRVTAPRKPGRPGNNLDRVLAVAVTLFNEQGYDYTSMFDIATALGITKSSVYHHIDAKEHILKLAIDRALDGLFEAADEVDALDAPAVVRLEVLIRRSVLVLAERLEFVTLLLRVHGNTEVEQHALLRRRDLDVRVTDIVKQAQADGDIRADVDPAATARLLFGMVNSLTEWFKPDRGAAEQVADTVTALAFDGLRTRQEG